MSVNVHAQHAHALVCLNTQIDRQWGDRRKKAQKKRTQERGGHAHVRVVRTCISMHILARTQFDTVKHQW